MFIREHTKATSNHAGYFSLDKAVNEACLSKDEAYNLIYFYGSELEQLCSIAAQMRDKGKGTNITFSPKVFIPLTHLCRDYCGYCTFRVDPEQATRLYMSPDEVLKVAQIAETLGCTEALFTLGERPEQRYPEARDWLTKMGYKTTLEYLSQMCKLVIEETQLLPHANPGTMTYREVEDLKNYNPSMGLMLESTSPTLYANGGPHEFAPSKRPRVRLRTIEIAGELRVPFTTGILIGIGESLDDRIESLLAIRRIHNQHGNIQEVIIQNFRSKSRTPMEKVPDATEKDLLWTIAAARLILGAEANIQVPPNLSSANYENFLDAGINDWGGVSPLTIDYVNPEAPWPLLTDLRDRTRSKGFELQPRLSVYPEYFIGTDYYLPVELKDKVMSMSNSNGYIRGGIQRYVGND